MKPMNSPSQVITFYSYKGGTGRTMALSNVACVLAQHQTAVGGKGVLMIDWDLEAPGLHRYFRNNFKGELKSLSNNELADESPGLIDLFYDLDKVTNSLIKRDGAQSLKQDNRTDPIFTSDSETLARSTLDKVKPESYAIECGIESLHLIKAGSFDRKDPEYYSSRVSAFQWEKLYQRSPMLIRMLADRLAERFQYILIDSRTGVTDISGICTMLMPEKLVVVFTPNLQSILGGIEQIERAAEYRRQSYDLRPLVVYPLVSRVDASRSDLRKRWRFGDKYRGINGYEPEFEKLFQKIYRLNNIKLVDYFEEIQIQHSPDYAYGEEIAVLVEETSDRFSLKRSYYNFAQFLVTTPNPWVNPNQDQEDHFNQEHPPKNLLSNTARKTFEFIRNHKTWILVTGQMMALVLSIYFMLQMSRARLESASAKDQLAEAQKNMSQREAELGQLYDQIRETTDANASLAKLLKENQMLEERLMTTQAASAKQAKQIQELEATIRRMK